MLTVCECGKLSQLGVHWLMHNQIQLRRACVANSSCCGSSCILHYSCSIGFHCNNLIACFWIQQLRDIELYQYYWVAWGPETHKSRNSQGRKTWNETHTHTYTHKGTQSLSVSLEDPPGPSALLFSGVFNHGLGTEGHSVCMCVGRQWSSWITPKHTSNPVCCDLTPQTDHQYLSRWVLSAHKGERRGWDLCVYVS